MYSARTLCPKSRKLILNGLLCVLITAVFPVSVLAQATALISGTVKDEAGAVVPGVTVRAENLETGMTRVVVSNDTGRYRVVSLSVGDYKVRAELAGFKTETKTGIHLTVGQEGVVNFVLQLGEITEEVTVTGFESLVNTTTASISGLVGEREVKNLPLNGRSLDNLITLNPGTVDYSSAENTGDGGVGKNFSIAGRRPQDNIFLLNGIDYTGTSVLNTTPGGVSTQLLGVDAIREFNVLTDTYSAEYGKRMGGQVSIVTMSGTNEFHGSAFEFHRNDNFDARNFFDAGDVPEFKRNNFGASAGGPIINNKTFIFGNYEGLRERLGLSNLAIVPDENARRGLLPDLENPGQFVDVGVAPGVEPYFALWPLPNGRNFGDATAEAFSNPTQKIRDDFFTVRVDHNFSETDVIHGVYTFQDGDREEPQTNPLAGRFITQRTQVVSIEENHIFSPTVTNRVTVGFTRAAFGFVARPTIDFPEELSFVAGREVGAIKIGGGIGAAASNITSAGGFIQSNVQIARNLFTFDDTISITRGSHLITAGVRIQKLQSNDDAAAAKAGQIRFGTIEDFLRGEASDFVVVLDSTKLGWRQLNGAWFVQDNIKVSSNFTLNLGFRHEFANLWNEVNGRAPNFIPEGPNNIFRTEPRVADSIFTENHQNDLFAPRVGLAWDPFGRGKTSIRAGAGIYYGILDNNVFCCDGTAPFNTRGSLLNVKFPIRLVPGVDTIPAGSIAPQGIQPDIRNPTLYSWNLKVEQELTQNMLLSVGYVGSHGYHNTVAADGNSAIPTILPDGTKFFPKDAPRRNPNLATGRNFYGTADSWYHGFQVDVSRRFSQGFVFRANHTWSHSIDESSQSARGQGQNAEANLLDPEDPARDKGNSNFDIRNRFNFNAVWELPIGRDKPFLNGVTGVADKLLSGWQLNTIVNLQDGFPFTPVLGFNQSRNRDRRAPDRPDLRPGTDPDDLIIGDPQQWYDGTGFLLPAAGTFGNAGRGILEGPGLATVDLSLFKNTSLSERVNLQFRFEGFNIFNRTNLNIPKRVVLDNTGKVRGSAGRITKTSTTSRQLQFGFKIVW